MSCQHGMMMDGTPSAADVSAHVDHMLKHLYVETDATEAQKAQIAKLRNDKPSNTGLVANRLPLRFRELMTGRLSGSEFIEGLN